jgi:hypothetical protein
VDGKVWARIIFFFLSFVNNKYHLKGISNNMERQHTKKLIYEKRKGETHCSYFDFDEDPNPTLLPLPLPLPLPPTTLPINEEAVFSAEFDPYRFLPKSNGMYLYLIMCLI